LKDRCIPVQPFGPANIHSPAIHIQEFIMRNQNEGNILKKDYHDIYREGG